MMNTAKLAWFLFLLVSFGVSIWSYILVDPNLVLISQPQVFALQQWFWAAQQNWVLVSLGYFLLVVLAWMGYIFLAKHEEKRLSSFSTVLRVFFPIVLVLWFGHNALSHDIFNYLFNAKMLLQYGANPHVQAALDFAADPWVRFMHNTHTPAPYGYGWTLFSLIPTVLGSGIFLLTYLLMKGWMIFGLVLYWFFGWRLLQHIKVAEKEKRFLIFALNPLLLWETVLNGHNDVWMMWPILAAYFLLFLPGRSLLRVAAVVGLFVLSVSIKFATVLLVPVAILLLLQQVVPEKLAKVTVWGRVLSFTTSHWAEISAMLLLLPLLTARSQQFHPWYLIWAWSFVPFLRWRWLQVLLLVLAFTSQLRYLPWLLNSLHYNQEVLTHMRLITWSAVPISVLVWWATVTARYFPRNK